jgi:hypothetical protein
MNKKYVDVLNECSSEILHIEKHINKDKFSSLNPFLISYSVIKACGTIETVYKNLVADKISIGATAEANYFLDVNIRDSSSNPSTGNISKLLQNLNGDWLKKFETQISGKQEKASLNSLVSLRNDFAHGRNAAPSIANVKKYFEDARSIITWLNEIISSH